MDIYEFMAQKKLSDCGNFWYVKKDGKLFIKKVSHKNNKLRLPKALVEMAGESAIEEIGPEGRKIHIENLTITL